MLYIVVAFIVSYIVCFIIYRYKDKLRFSIDTQQGPQKFHKNPTPRIGGLGIFLGLAAIVVVAYFKHSPFTKEITYFFLASALVFFIGLLEDITKKVSPMVRFITPMVASVILFVFLGAKILRLSIPILDNWLTFIPLSLLITMVAASGVTNAFNIIDGFNGLSSGIAMMVLLALAYMSFIHNDVFLLHLSLALASAIFAFFLFNYPMGLIFLGDGGAYLIGFSIAEICIILVQKHQDISPWFTLLLVVYPVFETLFSMYRKKFLRNTQIMQPDRLHLHMIVYKRKIKNYANGSWEKNAKVSPYLWFLNLLPILTAVMFYKYTIVLFLMVLIFAIIYIRLYFSIVRFKKRIFF